MFTCRRSSIAVTPRTLRSCSSRWQTSAILHCIKIVIRGSQFVDYQQSANFANNYSRQNYWIVPFTSLSINVLLASLNIKDHSWYSSSSTSRQAKHSVRSPNWEYCSTASTKVLVCCPEVNFGIIKYKSKLM